MRRNHNWSQPHQSFGTATAGTGIAGEWAKSACTLSRARTGRKKNRVSHPIITTPPATGTTEIDVGQLSLDDEQLDSLADLGGEGLEPDDFFAPPVDAVAEVVTRSTAELASSGIEPNAELERLAHQIVERVAEIIPDIVERVVRERLSRELATIHLFEASSLTSKKVFKSLATASLSLYRPRPGFICPKVWTENWREINDDNRPDCRACIFLRPN